jgi:serine/threonine-protein kinase
MARSRILSLVAEAHAGMMVTPSVRLVRPLGEGGMGAVWVADHLALSTQVVVKFIANELRGMDDAKERFEREAKAASQVKSPHVVQTFDHGTTADGVPYIVMELLEGQDLERYLEKRGKIESPQLVVDIVAQLARALDRAHERGIVHRDIKPGNIFLCESDAGEEGRLTREVFVKLLDFGIAKGVDLPKIDSNTKTGAMIGSPFYMSPEQILGSKVDKRSDLWSVGVVAFEALTGKKPFDAETMGGLAIRIHSEPLPMPSKLAPELGLPVDEWFKRACARNVEERFRSAKELAESLAKAVGGEMPRSIEVPRISTGSNERGSQVPTLATTEAGVVRSTAGTTRRSVVVGAALVVLLGVTAFGITSAFTKSAGSGARLVADTPPPPSTSVAGTALNVTPPPPPPPPPPAPPPTDPNPPTQIAGKPAIPVGKPGIRPLPPPKHSATIPSPPSTTVAAPPSPTAPSAVRPAASGHDIF